MPFRMSHKFTSLVGLEVQDDGVNSTLFKIYKFRSMKKNTPNVATHLLTNPDQYLLKIGKFIRKISLDELPNLINIIKGDCDANS